MLLKNEERNTTKAKPSTTQNPNKANYQENRSRPILLNHDYRTSLSQNTIQGQDYLKKQ